MAEHLMSNHKRGLLTTIITLALLVTVPNIQANDNVNVNGLKPNDSFNTSKGLIYEKTSSLVRGGQLPGALILIARQGNITSFDTIGFRDLDSKLPVNSDTLFRFYSLSKPIIATAAMILIDENRLNLDDPLEKYLPEFKNISVYYAEGNGSVEYKPAKHKILVKHLLTHTSGLTYIFMPSPVSKLYEKAGLRGSPHDNRYHDLAEWSSSLAAMPLISDPGEAWNYSVGIDVLGRLIEIVSGLSLGEFLSSKLFQPLGMKDTGFRLTPENNNRLASLYMSTGHRLQLKESFKDSVHREPAVLEMGGSGLIGTAADYFRFAQMLLNNGELEGVRVLTSNSVAQIVSNQLPLSPEQKPISQLAPLQPEFGCDGLGFGYGGFVVIEDKSDSCLPLPLGSYGWSGAASTYFWIDPESQIVGLYLTQVMGGGEYRLFRALACTAYHLSC